MTVRPEPFANIGQPISRTDLVADAIKRAILDRSLAPGEALSERHMATRLGVSRTPVRDALKLLRLTGLVNVSSFQRVTVRRVDRVLVHELYQARALVEPAAIGLAVAAHASSGLPQAEAALAQADAAAQDGDMASLSLANRTFHRELYSGCANRFLRDQLDQLQDLTALSAAVGWRRRRTSDLEAAEHRRMLEACVDGDAELAESLALEHVTSARETLLRAIDEA